MTVGHNGSVTAVKWSRDNKWLITSSDDRSASVWSVGMADPVMTFSLVNNNFGADKEGGLKPSAVCIILLLQYNYKHFWMYM